ncbi:MAG: sigma-70 family RNA polymerase sigma factor [Firmicutes bacterium]|nr:sigma-70 family RNA polymerase sigma factor [Bacillota bacterium]
MLPDLDSPYHAPEVKQWVSLAQKGDDQAFARLVERFQRDVYGKAFSIVKNHLDADDVVQETFLRVHRALPKFRFEASFRTWLLTITTRQALNFLDRQRSGHESLDGMENGQEHAALRVDHTPLMDYLDHEALQRLKEALPKLPPRQRQVVSLKLEHDWKYEEIAREIGGSVGSVKAHIFHAIKNLTRHMKEARP